jgi:hypothetical protein
MHSDFERARDEYLISCDTRKLDLRPEIESPESVRGPEDYRKIRKKAGVLRCCKTPA